MRKRGLGFWALQVPGWLLLVYLIYAQGISAFSYQLGVAMGTQEPAEVLTEVGTAFWYGFALGDLLTYRLDRHDEAEANYRKAVDVAPNRADRAWMQLAKLYVRTQKYQDAEQAYREAAELDPRHACPWRGLGALFRDQLGRYAESEEAFRKAIEIGPDDASAWAGLGQLLHGRLGRYEEAEEAYRKAIATDEQYIRPRCLLAKLFLADLEEPEQALGVAQQSVEAIPDQPVLLNSLAWDFYLSGPVALLPHAEAWARAALTIQANEATKHTLACVLARAREGRDALALMRQIIADPGFVENNIDDMVTLLAELVAAGCAREAYRTLRDSENATTLEPALVALQMYLGDQVHVAVEIAEVAKDVRKRFEEVCRKRAEERGTTDTCGEERPDGDV